MSGVKSEFKKLVSRVSILSYMNFFRFLWKWFAFLIGI